MRHGHIYGTLLIDMDTQRPVNVLPRHLAPCGAASA
jgi:hypothetical protein